MSPLGYIIVIILAIAGPRVLGLVDSNSSLVAFTLWGAAFGAFGGVLASLFEKLVLKKRK